MTEKHLFATREIPWERGGEGRLWYYALEEQAGCPPQFGVLVEMERAGQWESASVPHVTASPERLEEILALLSRNTVTPCTLYEILREEINKF